MWGVARRGASSVYGVPRATQDVDLAADLKATDTEKLEQLLSGDFYVDADMIREAIAKRASFNVIHLATMFKADVFITKPDAWSREEMSRARQEQLDGPNGAVTIRFASPEDTLLHKLVWFRLGNEIIAALFLSCRGSTGNSSLTVLFDAREAANLRGCLS